MENNCPVCGEPSIITCRCMRAESMCNNKHEWCTCLVHNKKVVGKFKHDEPLDRCICDKGEGSGSRIS